MGESIERERVGDTTDKMLPRGRRRHMAKRAEDVQLLAARWAARARAHTTRVKKSIQIQLVCLRLTLDYILPARSKHQKTKKINAREAADDDDEEAECGTDRVWDCDNLMHERSNKIELVVIIFFSLTT